MSQELIIIIIFCYAIPFLKLPPGRKVLFFLFVVHVQISEFLFLFQNIGVNFERITHRSSRRC